MRLYEQSVIPSQIGGGNYKIAGRMEPINPKDVGGIIDHGGREVGEFNHIVESKARLNVVMIGSDDIAEEVLKEAKEMAEFNRLSALSKRKFKTAKAANEAVINTPLENPWRENRKQKGCMREGILAVRRDFFLSTPETKPKDRVKFLDDKGEMVEHDLQKYRDFYKAGKHFLKETFGALCVYARFDGDEQSGHIHFILKRVVEKEPSIRYPQGRKVYQISDVPLVGAAVVENGEKKFGYEKFQDAAGEFFETHYPEMNIVRGERKAQAKRQAKAEGEKIYAQAKADGVMLPDGSKNAQILFLIRQKIDAANAKKKMRGDERDGLALDYLAALGAITEKVRNESSTRRARQALLSSVEELYGTSQEILAKPDLVAEKVIEQTREKVSSIEESAAEKAAKADRRDEQTRKMRKEHNEMRQKSIKRLKGYQGDLNEREAAAKKMKEEAEALKAENEKKAKELAEREAATAKKEKENNKKESWLAGQITELKRKTAEFEKTLAVYFPLMSAIDEVADRFKLRADPMVQKAIKAGQRMRELTLGRERKK